MDLRLLPPSSLPPAATSRAGLAGKPLAAQLARGAGSAAGVATGGFPDAFQAALRSVSQAQNQATRLQREVQMDNPKVSLEETMLAIQKAQIGFQSALHVRNRMVQAYTDIMNMQV